jgi:hypothetical protein
MAIEINLRLWNLCTGFYPKKSKNYTKPTITTKHHKGDQTWIVFRLRETIGALPTRADIRDLELRLGERMDSLAARFDRAFDPRSS